MKRISFILTFLVWIASLYNGPLWSRNTPNETWQQANEALLANNLEQALSLYKKVLLHCEISENLPGKVDALEAIALVYYKQEQYSLAGYYCRKSLRTGAATFRAYYLLAQVEYEYNHNPGAAQEYCVEGLGKFPRNRQLSDYYKLLSNRESQRIASSKPLLQKTAGERDQRNLLSKVEQEILEEMNLARQYPAAYARHLENLRNYYEDDLLKAPGKTPVRTLEGTKAVDEAIRFLKTTKPVRKLRASEGLSQAARDHVNDQGRSGKTGHIGQDGSKPYERMERYGSWEGLSGENIAYGDETARMIVMQLIIDDGVPTRGHRENIFNPEFQYTGVAVGPHPVYRTMCVINYAGIFVEKSEKREQ